MSFGMRRIKGLHLALGSVKRALPSFAEQIRQVSATAYQPIASQIPYRVRIEVTGNSDNDNNIETCWCDIAARYRALPGFRVGPGYLRIRAMRVDQ